MKKKESKRKILVLWLKIVACIGRVLCGCGVSFETFTTLWSWVIFRLIFGFCFSSTVGLFPCVYVTATKKIILIYVHIHFVTWNDSHFLYILFRELKMLKGLLYQQKCCFNQFFFGCFNPQDWYFAYWCL